MWLSYAKAEAAHGRADEAFKVYRSALSLCAPPTGDAAPIELLPVALAAAQLSLSTNTSPTAAPTHGAWARGGEGSSGTARVRPADGSCRFGLQSPAR